MGRGLTPRALVLSALLAAACSGGATGPDSSPSAPGPPQSVTLEVRDLLSAGEPPVDGAALFLDGAEVRPVEGTLAVELTPGRHRLGVRHPGYREDLFALRFSGEEDPRSQAVGVPVLSFDLRPGDSRAQLLLVSRSLDVPFVVSLLDDGVSYRWRGPADLHVDLTPAASGFVLPPDRMAEVVVFVKAALEELSGGALTLGQVTTGTGLGWQDFLHGERPGAITLQFADLVRTLEGMDVNGWGLYREDPQRHGRIRSGNVVLDVEALRTPIRDFRPALGHELGHALSLQHPLPCHSWTRMDAGQGACTRAFDVNPAPGTFWSPSERAAGKLIYTFRPATDFKALTARP